jgi:hypothetical protein
MISAYSCSRAALNAATRSRASSITSARNTWAEPPASPIMLRIRRKARSAAGDAGTAATAFTGNTAPIAVSRRRIVVFSPWLVGSR